MSTSKATEARSLAVSSTDLHLTIVGSHPVDGPVKPGHDMTERQTFRYKTGKQLVPFRYRAGGALGCEACPGTGNDVFCGGMTSGRRSGRSGVASPSDFPSRVCFAPEPIEPSPISELQPLTKILATAANATPDKNPLNLSIVNCPVRYPEIAFRVGFRLFYGLI